MSTTIKSSKKQRAAVRRAIAAVPGKQIAVAKEFDLWQSAVSKWVRSGWVPPKHVLRLEAISGVSRHDLRPDIYPAP